MAPNGSFSVRSLRGGYNDFDPPRELQGDECTQADNVEFWTAPCGARRNGSTHITLPAALSGHTQIPFIFRHLPTTDETAAQLWALGVNVGASYDLQYKDTTWNAVTMSDPPHLSAPYPFQWSAVTLHGKVFICYHNAAALDRLHVCDETLDGNVLRRAGIAGTLVAPVATNSAAGGAYTGTRYFRIRWTRVVGGVTKLRSEPTPNQTFVPDGAHTGAVIAQPTPPGESETHWEVEGSLDNANFYLVTALVLATTTYTDTTSSAAGYNAGTLSDTIGHHTVPGSARKLVADEDRLVGIGNFTNAAYASRIYWTPVAQDPTAPLYENDERVPLATANTLDMNNYEGGPLTDGGGAFGGQFYAFKWSHIYRLGRTGQATNSYQPVTVTKKVGALPGSVVEGLDESGRAALYFLDPKTGPWRIGSGGLQWAGRYIWNTWQRVNLDATQMICCGIFYPDKKQVHWWISVDGGNTPALWLTLQTNNSQTTAMGVVRGWSRHTGAGAQALSACLFASNIEANAARSMKLKPFKAVGATIQIGDTGSTDDGTAYTATIVTGPNLNTDAGVPNLVQDFGVRAAALTGTAVSGAAIDLSLIRNFGVETSVPVPIGFTPSPDEGTSVIRSVDDVTLGECTTAQIQITDNANSTANWNLHEIAVVLNPEGHQ